MNCNIIVSDTELVKQRTVEFNNGSIRMIIASDGEPRFVAKDLATAIGVEPIGHYLDHIPVKYKGMHRIHTPGGAQEMTCLTEPGMNQFLFRSNKQAAIPWQEHLAEVILPSIRKTGAYLVKPMSALDLLEAQCRALREVESRQLAQEAVQASHEQKLSSVTETIKELVASDAERRELEESAAIELRQLPPATVCAPGKTLRALVNECVRQYATRHGGGKSYSEAWRKLYSELFYRCNFNAKVRAKHSGLDKIEEVENAGLLEQLYAIALDVLAQDDK
jgi:prophage antirepressor-like protein